VTDEARKFVTAFTSVLSNCSLYSAEHEAVEELFRKTLSILEKATDKTGNLEIMLVDSDVIINKMPFRDTGMYGSSLARRFRKRGISRVDFLKGVTYSELKQFISDMVEPDGQVRSLPHIRAGIINVRLSVPVIDIEVDAEGLFRLATLQLERTKRVYLSISSDGKLNAAGVEEIIRTFIEAFRKKANILKLLSPVHSFEEHSHSHAVSVAVLSMLLAESLGAKEELLYDIGIAALLHDVGKLFISKAIREKTGSLDEKEWEEIRQHTVYGARYLARTEGLTRIAPLVALEHHRRYDGQGYPSLAGKGRKQHLFTQIIAISDFLDSMRNRQHRKEKGIAAMLPLIEKGAGTEFNPFLVNHFSKVVKFSLEEMEEGEA